MDNQADYKRLLEDRLTKIEGNHSRLEEIHRDDIGLIFKKLEQQGQRQGRLLAMSNLISVLIGGAVVEIFKAIWRH